MAQAVHSESAREERREPPRGGHAAIDVRGLRKCFRIPAHEISTLKERALHPLRRTEHRELHTLDDISFQVAEGEFFGIVGRNGSGKSTLLKCLAGIYRADAGELRVAGRLAPFIELGVGFNPDLTARDNVLVNAVMMGLSPTEARERFDSIVRFAELGDFLEVKLKNYSSGMQVRLAFAVMVQSDADILLIDEVLAVGDAAFQAKCFDTFDRLKAEGRTIVLVTHDMTLVERFCHRGLLLDNGRIAQIGAPHEVADAYFEVNRGEDRFLPGIGGEEAVIADVWLEDDTGRRVERAAHGDALHFRALMDVHSPVAQPQVDFWVDDERGARIFGASSAGRDLGPITAGERLEVAVRVENRLAAQRFHVGCSLLDGPGGSRIVALDNRAAAFAVHGAPAVWGLVALEHELSVERRPAG